MASKTTYTCDRCGDTSTSSSFLKDVTLIFYKDDEKYGNDWIRNKEVCKKCKKELAELTKEFFGEYKG